VVAFPQRPIINPQDAWRRMDGARAASHTPQQCIRTDSHREPSRAPRAGLAAQREADQMERLIEAECAPSMGGDDPQPGVHRTCAADTSGADSGSDRYAVGAARRCLATGDRPRYAHRDDGPAVMDANSVGSARTVAWCGRQAQSVSVTEPGLPDEGPLDQRVEECCSYR
jgi:hypothetical protein